MGVQRPCCPHLCPLPETCMLGYGSTLEGRWGRGQHGQPEENGSSDTVGRAVALHVSSWWQEEVWVVCPSTPVPLFPMLLAAWLVWQFQQQWQQQ